VRFALYLVVGVVAWLVDLAIYHALWPLIGIAAGQLLARIAGAVTAFLLNRWKTFKAGKGLAGIGSQAFNYVVLLVLNWAITVGLIYFLSYGLDMHPLTAKIVVDIAVVPGNYLFMKYWVFRSGTCRVDQ
jgi:putative flippase GtrA